jgi:hypothetical protein
MEFNFLDLYKKIQSLDSPLRESMQPPIQAIGAAPSGPTIGDGGGQLTYECDGMPENHTHEQPKQQDSVTMSINMNGNGSGGIRDLMNILKNIEQEMPSNDVDVELNRDNEIITSEPSELDIDNIEMSEPEEFDEIPEPVDYDDEIELDEPEFDDESDEYESDEYESDEYELDEVVDEPMDYANNPDIQQQSVAAVIGSGDDINRSKTMFARSQPGDNAKAVSESLIRQLNHHYTEVKSR